MSKYLLIFIAFVFLNLTCLFAPFSTFAAQITLSTGTQSISVNDEYDINVHLSVNASDGTTYYLRGVFYQTAGKYCGFTWNGSSWYSSPVDKGEYFLPVTLGNGVWDGQLKAKFDSADSDCGNSGQYTFRVIRYTSSGASYATETTNEQSVSVSLPTPTITPSPTVAPTSSPTNPATSTPSSKSSTSTPTIKINISAIATLTPLPALTKVSSPTQALAASSLPPASSNFLQNNSTQEAVVLGISKSASRTPTLNVVSTKVLSSNFSPSFVIVFSLGLIFLVSCGIVTTYLLRHK
jgi:hypothetical protein